MKRKQPPGPTPISLYYISIEVKWHDAAGNLLGGPPTDLPADFRITAQSTLGDATCTYSAGSLLCQYSNQSGSNSGLQVPYGSITQCLKPDCLQAGEHPRALVCSQVVVMQNPLPTLWLTALLRRRCRVRRRLSCLPRLPHHLPLHLLCLHSRRYHPHQLGYGGVCRYSHAARHFYAHAVPAAAGANVYPCPCHICAGYVDARIQPITGVGGCGGSR